MASLTCISDRGSRTIGRIAPIADLLFRIWIANIFFKAGLTKISNWPSTLFLFESEYAVPLLSPEIAAYLATAAELTLPVLLVLGFGTRFVALALFTFNIAAVISYPGLTEAGRDLHTYWGFILLALMAHGGGVLSVDGWLARRRQARRDGEPPAVT